MDKPDIKYQNTVCIYCLKNEENGKRYVGKTTDLYRRMRHYFYDFKHERNDHINDYLLNSMKKHGLDSFSWTILEEFDEINEDQLKEKELFYMREYNTTDRECGYNLRRDSSTQMIVHEETSKKISKRLEEEWSSGMRDDHGEKLSEWWENNPEEKEKQAEVLRDNITKWKYKLWKNDNYLGEFVYDDLKDFDDINASSIPGAFYQREQNPVDYKQYTVKRIRV